MRSSAQGNRPPFLASIEACGCLIKVFNARCLFVNTCRAFFACNRVCLPEREGRTHWSGAAGWSQHKTPRQLKCLNYLLINIFEAASRLSSACGITPQAVCLLIKHNSHRQSERMADSNELMEVFAVYSLINRGAHLHRRSICPSLPTKRESSLCCKNICAGLCYRGLQIPFPFSYQKSVK